LNQHDDDAKLWFICDTRNAPVSNLYIVEEQVFETSKRKNIVMLMDHRTRYLCSI